MKKMLSLISSLFFAFSFADEFVEASTTIGGYGELHWDMENENMDFHRFIVFLNHNFDDKWALKSEIELEHNMAGDGYGGYIALEQAYLNYTADSWDARAGVVLAPVGIINETHEPPTFLSVERPDYAKYIIPTTWFGNGMQFNYNFGDFRFGVTMMEDIIGGSLSTDGTSVNGGAAKDSKYAFRSGRGKGDDSFATDLTKIFGFSWTGMEGLKVAGSMTMNEMPMFWDADGDWESKGYEYGDLISATVGLEMTELNVQYNMNNIVAVFETATGSFDYADLNTWLATNNVVNSFDDKDFEGMRLDLGYNIGSLIGDDCDLTLWTRQTSWDSNTNTNANANVGEVSRSMFGVTWKPKNNISLKMNMGTTDTDYDGGSSSSDMMQVGVGYMF